MSIKELLGILTLGVDVDYAWPVKHNPEGYDARKPDFLRRTATLSNGKLTIFPDRVEPKKFIQKPEITVEHGGVYAVYMYDFAEVNIYEFSAFIDEPEIMREIRLAG